MSTSPLRPAPTGLPARGSRSTTRAEAAALRVAPRLHRAAPGHLCGCGPCRHHVARAARAARAAGLEPAQVAAALGTADPAPARGPAPRRALHAQVGATARVRVAGRDVTLAEGLVALSHAGASTPGR